MPPAIKLMRTQCRSLWEKKERKEEKENHFIQLMHPRLVCMEWLLLLAKSFYFYFMRRPETDRTRLRRNRKKGRKYTDSRTSQSTRLLSSVGARLRPRRPPTPLVPAVHILLAGQYDTVWHGGRGRAISTDLMVFNLLSWLIFCSFLLFLLLRQIEPLMRKYR